MRKSMKKDHDYGIYLAIIAIWMIIGGLAQCESARELSNIRHELNMMRYK